MRRPILAVLSLWISLALAPAAGAVLTPSGTTLLTLAAGDYQIGKSRYAGSSIGTMTTNSLNGRSASGSSASAIVAIARTGRSTSSSSTPSSRTRRSSGSVR